MSVVYRLTIFLKKLDWKFDFSFGTDMSIITTVALLVFLIIPEGISQGDPVVIQRCRCISTERRPMGRYIDKVDVNPASSHCKDIEIIATLKSNGKQICLDPSARWVIKVLERRSAGQTR